MKKILFTLPLDDAHKDLVKGQANGCREEAEIRFVPKDALTEADVKGVDAILGDCPAALLNASGTVKWLQLPFAGVDPYVVPGYVPADCVLTNATGAYDLTVSEHMVALCFALLRRLEEYARNQARAEWRILGTVYSVEDSTVLVLGAGNIGSRFAAKMKALGAYTIGVCRRNKARSEAFDEVHTFEEVDSLLPRADIVAMVLPGSKETVHFMDERRLRLMKETAVLVNMGRGSAIDPAGLKKVLAEGHLFGAALDVTEPEPLPADDALWQMENVIITPHSAGQFLLKQTFENVVQIFCDNLKRYLNGEALRNIVDKEAGY